MLIQKLQLLTDDIQGTVKFYGEILGLRVLQQSNEEISLAAGATELCFRHSKGEKPRYHFAFNIPCNQAEEAAAWMRGKAELLELEPGNPIADFSNWNARAFYFLDNNENIVEFIARNDLHNESATAFGPSGILSVSEIGIVSDDVSQRCRALIEKFGLRYFSKQPPLPRFAALGDDSGLLIIVPYQRDWYPTKIPSKRHWVKVDMVVDGKEAVLELYNHSE